MSASTILAPSSWEPYTTSSAFPDFTHLMIKSGPSAQSVNCWFSVPQSSNKIRSPFSCPFSIVEETSNTRRLSCVRIFTRIPFWSSLPFTRWWEWVYCIGELFYITIIGKVQPRQTSCLSLGYLLVWLGHFYTLLLLEYWLSNHPLVLAIVRVLILGCSTLCNCYFLRAPRLGLPFSKSTMSLSASFIKSYWESSSDFFLHQLLAYNADRVILDSS